MCCSIPATQRRRAGFPPKSLLRIERGLRLERISAPCARRGIRARRAGQLEIFAGLRDFREHLGGELCVTFPQGIGARFEMHEIDLPLMQRCLENLPRT